MAKIQNHASENVVSECSLCGIGLMIGQHKSNKPPKAQKERSETEYCSQHRTQKSLRQNYINFYNYNIKKRATQLVCFKRIVCSDSYLNTS